VERELEQQEHIEEAVLALSTSDEVSAHIVNPKGSWRRSGRGSQRAGWWR
jgi:hypothetical protein